MPTKSATFNEFQRELNKRIGDPQVAFMLTMLYERLGQVLQEHEEMAKMMVQFAESLAGFVQLNEIQKEHIIQIARKVGMVRDAEVKSVANDPTEH